MMIVRYLDDRRLVIEARFGESDGPAAVSASSLPAGTVTFLLTDVEGSSRLWESDADAASAASVRRQKIIRDSTLRHSGALPLEQGEGDSSVSAFARASDAGACAVNIQRRLEAEVRSYEKEVLVRIALHTGETELRSDGTYLGAALNRCARLRAIGHGGQILVSQATYEVLIDSSHDVVLRDLGVHRLRDLARPEHVWQLCHPELVDKFPPLRSLDAVANNLPVQLTSFIGRETEIDALSAVLGEHRLVTLTGAGGCGKTRLALQVAAGVVENYPDGVWWMDLSALSDPSLVPATLAGVLGLRESPLEPIADTVVRHLSARRALVVLDNCEHLIDASTALATRLVQQCPAVTMMATSRELLGVEGETSWPVAPLSLPDNDQAESLNQFEAVRLFVDRARSSRPNFELTGGNAAAVTEICTRLDGIPLAIELAAARTRVLTVEQIAAGLADRFHLLTGGDRSALPRQRTLESSVDWSHDLLDDMERILFRRLATFAGSFTLDAVEAVCAGEGVVSEQVLDLMSRLVDRSLVQVVDVEGHLTRYRMLETIRDYARHKLTDASEAESIRDRQLRFLVSFAEQAAAGMEGPDLIAWLARVDADLDNLRAALDWSGHSADPDHGLRLVKLLTLYWFARSDLAIGRNRLEAALNNASRDGLERAGRLGTLCMINYRAGDMAKAGRYGDEAVTMARRLGDATTLARALHWRAWVRYWGEGNRFAAWQDFQEAAALLGQTDDRVFQTLNLALLAWSYIDTSEEAQARALLDEALALTDATGAVHARCYYRAVLGYLDLVEGRLEDASLHLREALALANQIGDHYVEIFARGFLSYTDLFRGRTREARDLCEVGLGTALENRSPTGEALMRLSLGFLAFAEGNFDSAAAQLEASFRLFALLMEGPAAICRAGQAQVALAQSLLPEADRYAAEALELAQKTGWLGPSVSALVVQSSLARVDGDAHTAEDLLHDALDLACHRGSRLEVCEILDGLAGAVADQGRFEESARLLGAGQALRDTIGYPRFPVALPIHEAITAVLRNALDSETFDQMLSEGAVLSLDDAVAYARRGRGERKRPTHGWKSLTPTELQIVELVAEGLTNPQIGERMFISKRTVQAHLSHVFDKLGVATRAELAARTVQQRAAAQ